LILLNNDYEHIRSIVKPIIYGLDWCQLVATMAFICILIISWAFSFSFSSKSRDLIRFTIYLLDKIEVKVADDDLTSTYFP